MIITATYPDSEPTWKNAGGGIFHSARWWWGSESGRAFLLCKRLSWVWDRWNIIDRSDYIPFWNWALDLSPARPDAWLPIPWPWKGDTTRLGKRSLLLTGYQAPNKEKEIKPWPKQTQGLYPHHWSPPTWKLDLCFGISLQRDEVQEEFENARDPLSWISQPFAFLRTLHQIFGLLKTGMCNFMIFQNVLRPFSYYSSFFCL